MIPIFSRRSYRRRLVAITFLPALLLFFHTHELNKFPRFHSIRDIKCKTPISFEFVMFRHDILVIHLFIFWIKINLHSCCCCCFGPPSFIATEKKFSLLISLERRKKTPKMYTNFWVEKNLNCDDFSLCVLFLLMILFAKCNHKLINVWMWTNSHFIDIGRHRFDVSIEMCFI